MTVTPTAAECDALNRVLGLAFVPGVTVEVPDKLITDALEDLDRKTMYPGTKLFKRDAAYHAEMLRRCVKRTATA